VFSIYLKHTTKFQLQLCLRPAAAGQNAPRSIAGFRGALSWQGGKKGRGDGKVTKREQGIGGGGK